MFFVDFLAFYGKMEKWKSGKMEKWKIPHCYCLRNVNME